MLSGKKHRIEFITVFIKFSLTEDYKYNYDKAHLNATNTTQ